MLLFSGISKFGDEGKKLSDDVTNLPQILESRTEQMDVSYANIPWWEAVHHMWGEQVQEVG